MDAITDTSVICATFQSIPIARNVRSVATQVVLSASDEAIFDGGIMRKTIDQKCLSTGTLFHTDMK